MLSHGSAEVMSPEIYMCCWGSMRNGSRWGSIPFYMKPSEQKAWVHLQVPGDKGSHLNVDGPGEQRKPATLRPGAQKGQKVCGTRVGCLRNALLPEDVAQRWRPLEGWG